MGGLLIFPVLLGVMYFVMIRPQQRRTAEHRRTLASLEVGDEILTSSGIYGVITEFDGSTLFIEVADGVEIKISRDSVTSLVSLDEADNGLDDQAEADDADQQQGPVS